MPNAGCRSSDRTAPYYPLSPGELADAPGEFVREFGLGLVGGCCGTTPEHLRQVVERGPRHGRPRARDPRPEPGAASLYQAVPFRQDTSYLTIGERTNANGSKAFREAMLAEQLGGLRRDRPRPDPRRRAPARPVRRLRRPRRRRRHARDGLPACDRVHPADRAGLHRAAGARRPAWSSSAAGRVVNSVNFEDGDGPDSRFARIMALVQEHGAAVIALTIDEEGQARTGEHKVAIAERLIADLTGNWGMRTSRHRRRLPDLPDRYRAGGDPPRRHRDHRGHPRTQAPPPGRADHAGALQHLVRSQPGGPASC